MATGATLEAAPEAVAPPPGNPRFPYLDGLRAIAACFVLVFHVVSGGADDTSRLLQNLSNEGVAIFFVLSGFLLYRPFIRARLTGQGVPSVKAYARRRALRIVPAYWLALTYAIIVAGASAVTAKHVPIYYLLLQDYSDAARYHGLPVAWTLSIEATYYLVLPLAAYIGLLFASRVRRPRLAPELLIVVGFVLSTAALHVLRPTAPAIILGYTDWFAGGMLLAVLTFLLPGRALALAQSVWAWVIAAALFVVADVAPYGTYGQHLLFAASATCVVVAAVFPAPNGPVTGLLRTRALLWLGLVSYGIYLWHVPLMDTWLKLHKFGAVPLLALTIASTVMLAAASYYLLEAPLLRLKR